MSAIVVSGGKVLGSGKKIALAAIYLVAIMLCSININVIVVREATAQALCAAGASSVFAIGGMVITIPCSSGLLIPAYNNVSANWQNAGLAAIGGYPTRSTVCATVNPSGTVPTGTGGTDVTAIQNAVNSCTSGQVVMLGAGSTSTAVVSLAAGSNSLTLVSGTLAIGQALLGAGLYPGETVTAGSGTSWTVAMPPVYGQSLSSETVTVATQFNFWVGDSVNINKSITVRGSGTCNQGYFFQAVCPTIINVYNGGIPDWAVPSPAVNAGNCGINSTSTASCNAAVGYFYLNPSTEYTPGWGGCGIDNTNPTTNNCGTTLTADAAQGSTSVQVTSTTHFVAGMWVMIDEDPQVSLHTSPTGYPSGGLYSSSDWLSTSGSPATMRLAGGDEPGFYSFIGANTSNRMNQEIHLITNVGTACGGTATANTICFDDPLTLAFRQSGSHDARLYWPTINGSVSNFVSQAGVENLSMTRTIGNGGAIQIEFCAYCWIKGVEVGGWNHGAFQMIDTARDLIDTCYTHLGYNLTNNGSEYSIAIDERATETEVTNCIDLWGGKGMVGRGSNTAVISYNYVDQTYYESLPTVIGDYWVEMAANGSHYAGTHHWLFEGNWTPNCDADDTHGNAIYHFFFRNWCTGLRSSFTDVSVNKVVNDAGAQGWVSTGTWPNVNANAPGLLRATGPMGWNYWFAFAGNVLGTSSQTTTGNGWVYQSPGCNLGTPSGQTNKSIWCSGWTGAGNTQNDPNLDGVNSPQLIFKNGDYDYVNAGIVDNASGYSQSFPSSFYTATEPAAFTAGTCTYSWPWITPSSGTKIQSNGCSGSGLPALARWNAGTPFVQP